MKTSARLSMRSKRENLQRCAGVMRERRAAGIKTGWSKGASGVVRLPSQASHRVVKRAKRPRLLKRSGPKPVYPPKQVRLMLDLFWFGSGQLCDKRLQAAAPE